MTIRLPNFDELDAINSVLDVVEAAAMAVTMTGETPFGLSPEFLCKIVESDRRKNTKISDSGQQQKRRKALRTLAA
jgi:hypothetical protein